MADQLCLCQICKYETQVREVGKKKILACKDCVPNYPGLKDVAVGALGIYLIALAAIGILYQLGILFNWFYK